MAIVIHCSGCKIRLTLGDDRAGSTFECPRCLTAITVPGGAPEPNHVSFAVEEVGRWLGLAFKLADGSGMDFEQQLTVMIDAGAPGSLASRLINLIPILLGRRFLARTGPLPKLADHYILIDDSGNERAVPFAACPVSTAIEAHIHNLDGHEVMMIPLIGMLGCEVVALNEILSQLGPLATESTFETLELAAPRMGLLTRVMIRMGK